jgi:hypothetical protein
VFALFVKRFQFVHSPYEGISPEFLKNNLVHKSQGAWMLGAGWVFFF